MEKYIKQILVLLFAVLLISALPVCGGGGGGGSPPEAGDTPFVGNTSPAVITNQNAKEIATSAYQGGVFGYELYIPMASSSMNEESAGMLPSFPMLFSSSVNEILEKVVFSLNSTQSSNSIKPSYSQGPITIDDPFGIGSITYSFTIDETTYSYSGSIQYNNYHVATNAYFNGTIIMTGSTDPDYRFYSYTISSTNFTFVYGSEVSTILEFEYTTTISYNGYYPSVFTTTVSYYWRDGRTGQVSWVTDYTMTQTFIYDSSSYPIAYELTVSGTFYHPVFGCVTITTIEPLRYDYYSWYPSKGIILITGANNSSIRVTFSGGNSCLLEVDSGGDGNYEYQEVVSWVYFY